MRAIRLRLRGKSISTSTAYTTRPVHGCGACAQKPSPAIRSSRGLGAGEARRVEAVPAFDPKEPTWPNATARESKGSLELLYSVSLLPEGKPMAAACKPRRHQAIPPSSNSKCHGHPNMAERRGGGGRDNPPDRWGRVAATSVGHGDRVALALLFLVVFASSIAPASPSCDLRTLYVCGDGDMMAWHFKRSGVARAISRRHTVRLHKNGYHHRRPYQPDLRLTTWP